MPQLDFVNVKATYKNKKKEVVEALHDISFSIPNGKICALLGPSGSGKSTILKVAAGLMDYEGDFRIDGYEMHGVEPKIRNVGWVSQEYMLYPHLTIYDNIAFPLKAMRCSRKEIDEKVEKITKELGIYEFLTRKPRQLSGGQQQRVALARAIIKSPSYILLDEPLANIDPMMKLEIKQFVREVLSSRNITAIYVTHDESEAFFLGDMIVRINEGLVTSVNVNERRNNND